MTQPADRANLSESNSAVIYALTVTVTVTDNGPRAAGPSPADARFVLRQFRHRLHPQ